jgi:hypothetical protein
VGPSHIRAASSGHNKKVYEIILISRQTEIRPEVATPAVSARAQPKSESTNFRLAQVAGRYPTQAHNERNITMREPTAAVDPMPGQQEQEGINSPQPLPSSSGDGFDLEEFRQTQAFADHAGGEKVLTIIPIRKPSKESWFRTHPDPNYRLATPVIELKERGETYLVVKRLWDELTTEATFISKLLVPTITRQGGFFLWPIKLPGSDGKIDDWNKSAMEAANLAKTKWVRLCPNKPMNLYDPSIGPDPQTDPIWPSKSPDEIIRIAFKGRIIENLDHPVIQQLRGQII